MEILISILIGLFIFWVYAVIGFVTLIIAVNVTDSGEWAIASAIFWPITLAVVTVVAVVLVVKRSFVR